MYIKMSNGIGGDPVSVWKEGDIIKGYKNMH